MCGGNRKPDKEPGAGYRVIAKADNGGIIQSAQDRNVDTAVPMLSSVLQ
jgi:hypothetical protein